MWIIGYIYWGYIGIMEKKMETAPDVLVLSGKYCWGYMGIMEKRMETTIKGSYKDYKVCIGVI